MGDDFDVFTPPLECRKEKWIIWCLSNLYTIFVVFVVVYQVRLIQLGGPDSLRLLQVFKNIYLKGCKIEWRNFENVRAFKVSSCYYYPIDLKYNIRNWSSLFNEYFYEPKKKSFVRMAEYNR